MRIGIYSSALSYAHALIIDVLLIRERRMYGLTIFLLQLCLYIIISMFEVFAGTCGI